MSAVLSIVRLTTVSTVTVALSSTTVSFSSQVTFATFTQVPFINAVAVIVNAYDSPAFKWSIMSLFPLYAVSLHTTFPNCSGTISSIVTIVALDGPLLVTFIVNTIVSPTCT